MEKSKNPCKEIDGAGPTYAAQWKIVWEDDYWEDDYWEDDYTASGPQPQQLILKPGPVHFDEDEE